MVTLTVFFEDPFWVGVVERAENDYLSTAKIVFGSEPTDRLVFQFILDSYQTLRFSEPVQGGLTAIKAKTRNGFKERSATLFSKKEFPPAPKWQCNKSAND